MDETNPQQAGGPGNSPGIVFSPPQASPAAPTGPDSGNLGTLSQVAASHQPPDEWKQRYTGLDRFYQQQVATLQGEIASIKDMVQQLVKPQPPAPAQSAPQAPEKKEQQGSDVLSKAVEQVQATAYRDALIASYQSPGSAGEGLPLVSFRDRIKVIAPAIGDDGSIDDAAQRKEIESMIDSLKAVVKTTHESTVQSIARGITPGSSPGGPAPDKAQKDRDDKYAEFKTLMEAIGTDEFLDLSKDEQARMESRYYTLLDDEDIQTMHGGSTRPTTSYEELLTKVANMERKQALLDQRLNNPLQSGVYR